MRIAYCLAGYLRSYKNNNFFENLVSQMPGDVFIHTWNEIIPGVPLNIEDAINFYRPAGIMIEDQFKFKQSQSLFGYDTEIQNYNCMWRSISESIKMANHYDVIVRFRADMTVDSPFFKSEVIDVFNNKNKLYVGMSDDCYHAGILTDNFAIGSKQVMFRYAQHYTQATAYRTSFPSNERALTAFLSNNRTLPDKSGLLFECSNLKYKIKRMDGYLVPNSQTIPYLSPQWASK